MTTEFAERTERTADQLAGRLITSTVAMFDVYSVYIGHRLGFYRALADAPATCADLAARTGCHERYTREWLEQQAATDILTVENPQADTATRRYSLPIAYREVLTDKESLNYLAPLPQLAVGATSVVDRLLDAYRTGRGIAFSDYGLDVREGQAGMNRAAFLYALPDQWLPAIPDIHARLRDHPAARIADIGCGAGWSSIGMARGYANVRVDAFDLDQASVELARRNVGEYGLSERVDIQLRDAGDPSLAGAYDLVTVFEALHDMSDPLRALKTIKRLIAPGGSALIVDERVNEMFTPAADEIERMMYGWSILHCLPAGMADQPSAATGTVLRPEAVQRMAIAAGFRSVGILPIDNLFFRFYRLVP
jgi:2-polyprenyl-3-methyl-5-hydroxy-6-metoxy-1,4-benzoquinol methylase